MHEVEYRVTVIAELRGIRAALEGIAAAVQPAPESELPGEEEICPHPVEARVNFSGQGTEEWTCRLCGHEYRARLGAVDSDGADVCTTGGE